MYVDSLESKLNMIIPEAACRTTGIWFFNCCPERLGPNEWSDIQSEKLSIHNFLILFWISNRLTREIEPRDCGSRISGLRRESRRSFLLSSFKKTSNTSPTIVSLTSLLVDSVVWSCAAKTWMAAWQPRLYPNPICWVSQISDGVRQTWPPDNNSSFLGDRKFHLRVESSDGFSRKHSASSSNKCFLATLNEALSVRKIE